MNSKSIEYINSFFQGNVENKTIIITGGNSGIGLESAKICAYLKMHVIITVRSVEKGNKAIEEIKNEVSDANVEMMLLDTSKEESIKEFVNNIKDKNIDIDVFYHNAGVYRQPYKETDLGDLMIATNYFGPFILTSLLLDYLHVLQHEVKMVFTSSVAANWWSKNDEYLLHPTPKQSRSRRYGNSKLMDAYLFNYLANNDQNNIKYYLVHPGTSVTGLIANNYPKFIAKLFSLFSNPIWKSSLSILKILSSDNKPFTFYGPTDFFYLRGYPKEVHFLDNKYVDVNEKIKESEEILNYKLIY